MKPKAGKFVPAVAILMLSFLISRSLEAQVTDATLSGTVAGPSGAAIPNATISIRNVGTSEWRETRSNSAGIYTMPGLAPGEYEVSVSVEGFSAKAARVTLAPGARQTLDMALSAQPEAGGHPPTAPANNVPNAPSSGGTAPSLSDLGFSTSQTRGSAEEQARLDKRTHMLKIHQRLGLITTAPLLATVITGSFAGGKKPDSTTRDLHAALGSATGVLYFTTAYYSIFAPKVPGTKTRGPIRFHKTMAWIHGPGMILTPILGAIAFDQKSRGEKIHGIASAHGPVAYVTAGAYGAALMSVTLKF